MPAKPHFDVGFGINMTQ